MKKLLILMMITLLIVAFIGCSKETSKQKTEEELRAKIKAELEAEQKEKEDEVASRDEEQEDNSNSGSNKGNENNESEVYNLSNLSNGDKVEGLTISDITFDNESTEFTLLGERTVKGRIGFDHRYYLGYYVHLNEPILNKPIVIELPSGGKINADFQHMDISDPHKLKSLLSIEQLEYIDAGNNNELQVEVVLKDFKYIDYHKSGTYQMCEISNINSIEFDGSVTSGNNLKEYNLSQLNPGDNIEGLTISDISFKDEGVKFTLSGKRTVQGKIKYSDSDFISGYYISFNEPLLNKPIVIELPAGEKMEIYFSSVEISNPEKLESLISKEQIEYIKAVPANEVQDGNELQIEVVLKDFTFIGIYHSEMFQECEIVDVLNIKSN